MGDRSAFTLSFPVGKSHFESQSLGDLDFTAFFACFFLRANQTSLIGSLRRPCFSVRLCAVNIFCGAFPGTGEIPPSENVPVRLAVRAGLKGFSAYAAGNLFLFRHVPPPSWSCGRSGAVRPFFSVEPGGDPEGYSGIQESRSLLPSLDVSTVPAYTPIMALSKDILF